jgi:serine/threonine protein kinase
MENGTVYDHLHLKQRDQHQPHLSWIQRLEICIGVAKGLHYLHTGTKNKIIHRDIKTTNILLDNNLVAKISDFGLSKECYTSSNTTVVKGSTGYLDPEYYQRRMLTEKSDLYSLGVVLLEVLSARHALISPYDDDDDDDDEHLNLAEWAKFCIENGNVEEIVDPNLEGSIVKECFELYLGVAMKCLADRGVERPSTGDVLQDLFAAMKFQKNGGNVQNGKFSRNDDLKDYSDLTPGIEFSDIMMPIGR